MKPMANILEVSHLTKHFGGLTAVNDVTFSVREGEIIGLIGPNGAGKTTAFSLLVGLIKPSAGVIRLDGVDVTRDAPHKRANAGITKTFQNATLFEDMTVQENATVGGLLQHSRVCDARRAARQALQTVGLESEADLLAADLTVVDRSRVEIARALATGPRILLVDEAMVGLTPTEVQTALTTLRNIRDAGTTLIVVEHNMGAIMALCERLIAFDHGAKIAEGSPDEVSQDPAVIESYLGRSTSDAAN